MMMMMMMTTMCRKEFLSCFGTPCRMYATTNRRLTQAPPQAECDKSHLQRACVCVRHGERECVHGACWMGARPASLPGPSRASWIGSSVVHPPGQSSARGEMTMATSSASKAQIRRGQGELSRACRLTSHDDANARRWKFERSHDQDTSFSNPPRRNH